MCQNVTPPNEDQSPRNDTPHPDSADQPLIPLEPPDGPDVVMSIENDTENEETDAPSDANALDEWKEAIREDFEYWLESLDEIPDCDEAGDDEIHETPDLYSFHEQLAAGNTEARKANRRTAEAFSQWGDTLVKFDGDLRLLREQLARQPVAEADALPRPWCLALIEIMDRLGRFAAAFASPPPKPLFGGTRWQAAWETQRQGFDILLSHVAALLKNAGITRIPVLHQTFDPATMSAVAAEASAQWPDQTVIEEVTPGYLLRGELLRVAQVKVCRK